MSAAFQRVMDRGEPTSGLLLVPQSMPIGQAIDDLELVCCATTIDDWVGTLESLPI